MLNPDSHPCFNPGACATSARVHLPVAPACNMQCGYCNRAYDCVNESRPGVTSSILSPFQALTYLGKVMEKMPVSVVGIAGPGDPFANPDKTMETLSLVREKYPDILLCVATNGLNLLPFVDDLARLQVSHVTLTVNAVDPEIGKDMYAWMRVGPYRFTGLEAAEALLERQEKSILALKAKGIVVKVNTVVVPGLNDDHVLQIAQKAKQWGVDYMNCMALIPVPGSNFEAYSEPSAELMRGLRSEAAAYVKQMSHCRRCRADAAGLLSESNDNGVTDLLAQAARGPVIAGPQRDCLALASREGVMINLHLGEAREFLIYRRSSEGFAFLETREAPPAGDQARWEKLTDLLSDCSHVLVSSIGEKPLRALKEGGIETVCVEGVIQEALDALFSGTDLHYMQKRVAGVCNGAGGGCNS